MKTLMILVAVGMSLNGIAAQASESRERALIAYMEVKSGTERQFLKAAQNVIEESRKESGNIHYQLHQSTTKPELFVFYELFESDADLQYHRNAPHLKAFLKTTEPITVKFTLEEYVPEG